MCPSYLLSVTKKNLKADPTLCSLTPSLSNSWGVISTLFSAKWWQALPSFLASSASTLPESSGAQTSQTFGAPSTSKFIEFRQPFSTWTQNRLVAAPKYEKLVVIPIACSSLVSFKTAFPKTLGWMSWESVPLLKFSSGKNIVTVLPRENGPWPLRYWLLKHTVLQSFYL